jgi:acyl-coenzyme A synthetase/AMP-(fatty) acid ligase
MDQRAKFYATGDRVVRDASGEYAYLGRDDHQIKLGGYRIELGEIEAALRNARGVSEAVALAWPVEHSVAHGLVAFVTGTGPSSDAVIEDARELLPKYMVPGRVCVLDQMPLNANGKIDRKALLESLTRD